MVPCLGPLCIFSHLPSTLTQATRAVTRSLVQGHFSDVKQFRIEVSFLLSCICIISSHLVLMPHHPHCPSVLRHLCCTRAATTVPPFIHTHTHTHTHSLSLSHTCMHTLPLPLTHSLHLTPFSSSHLTSPSRSLRPQNCGHEITPLKATPMSVQPKYMAGIAPPSPHLAPLLDLTQQLPSFDWHLQDHLALKILQQASTQHHKTTSACPSHFSGRTAILSISCFPFPLSLLLF